MRLRTIIMLGFGLVVFGPLGVAEELPLVFEEDFESGNDGWTMTDPTAWALVDSDGGKALALQKSSDYEPKVRSPKSIARIADLNVTDFVLEAKLKQTGREYGHRDLCIFFGYQDPSKFYYCHMATEADAHANSIFLVNDEARVSIATERTDGTDWGKPEFHTVRIERDTESGTITVYFDDMKKPIMKAEDKNFAWGSIGFGSFDDVGHFDNIKIWGKKKD